MTNEEFYKDELKVIMKRVTKDLLIDQIAVNKQGQPECCIKQSCDDCIFNGCCSLEAKKQWLEQEYVEPEQQVDWSKVKVDTPILVRESEQNPWLKRYFAKFKGGKVYAWNSGKTSWSIEDKIGMLCWKYAKLAESEETVWQRSELQKN